MVSDSETWMGAAGRSGDGTPLTPHSMMAIGSITKTFTAAEVLHLAAVGKVALDAPLSRYVPGQWTASGVTVRQALSMRSGLPDDAHVDALIRMLGQRHRHISAEQSVRTLISGRSSRPGGAPVYSSAAFLLLGLLIEHVTKQPFAAAVRADLIGPAGLDRIAVQDAERPVPPLAYPPARNGVREADGYLPFRTGASAAFSAGGIAADAPSIARWGYQLYGARVLSASTIQSMIRQSSQSDIFPSVGYGLGTMIFHNLQFTINDSFGHEGGVPGYVSLLAVVPERHLSIALLINDDGKDTLAIMSKLFTALR